MLWGLDLDGVVWRGTAPIPGSAAAIARIEAAGDSVVYITNNSALASTGYVQKLAGCGIKSNTDQIVHGGHAVAQLMNAGDRVLLCAGAGVAEAVSTAGAIGVPVDDYEADESQHIDAVIIGWRSDFDYRILSLAVRAVLAGARLLAPSADPLYPGNDGVSMGGGALTHAVAYASGRKPQFAGKPFQPMADVVHRRFGQVDIVVGDQPSTDGALAHLLGAEFHLVESGVAAHVTAHDVPIAKTSGDLAGVVDSVLS